MATSGPRFAAGFDERAWVEDVLDAYAERSNARMVAERARREFERSGVPADLLQPCASEGRDRTQLEGVLKLYLPLERSGSGRPFGMVFLPAAREGRIVLEFLAFGVRHQPSGSRAPSVYEIAHRRLHGRWP